MADRMSVTSLIGSTTRLQGSGERGKPVMSVSLAWPPVDSRHDLGDWFDKRSAAPCPCLPPGQAEQQDGAGAQQGVGLGLRQHMGIEQGPHLVQEALHPDDVARVTPPAMEELPLAAV